jgi:hypothetical protein
MSEPYLIRTDPQSVHLWSSVRLPYDGKGWKREMRDELGARIKAMTSEPDRVLHAVYEAANDGQVSDAENVLFYNVGSQHFRHLMLTGVRFERAYVMPIPPVQLEGPGLHHQSYGLADVGAGFRHWACGESFATFHGVHLGSITKVGAVWAALRTQARPPRRVAPTPTRFVLRLRVTRPPTWPGLNRSAADLIKPLLDGIIAAYHSHAELAIPSRAQAESAGLGSLVDLPRHLRDDRWAALGSRRLWWPNGGTRIQWNPADDYCVAAEILLDPTLTSGGWRLSGILHDASPVPTPYSRSE